MRKSWQTKKLSEIGTIFNGNSINERVKKEKYLGLNEGFSFIATKDVDFETHSINYENGVRIPFAENGFKIAHKNSILVCAEGGSAGKKVAFNERDICFGNKLFALETKADVAPRFVYYWYLTDDFANNFKGLMNGLIGGVSMNNFKTLQIPLPPLSEQLRIVSILEQALGKLEQAKGNIEKNLQNTKEVFESYLQNIFTNPGDDWEEKRLETISELISKGSSPKWQGVKYVDEPGVLFVTSENVGEGKMLLSEKKYVEEKFNQIEKKSILKKEDVLTNIVGASIGRTAIYDIDDLANINQAVCLIRCSPEILLNEYLMYLLNSPYIKQHLHDNEVNNARANLSLGFFRNLSIPLPCISIQKEIVEKIKSFHAETKRLEAIYQQKLSHLDELRKSLLKKAFNGEL